MLSSDNDQSTDLTSEVVGHAYYHKIILTSECDLLFVVDSAASGQSPRLRMITEPDWHHRNANICDPSCFETDVLMGSHRVRCTGLTGFAASARITAQVDLNVFWQRPAVAALGQGK